MLQTIAREIKESLRSASADDALLFDGKQFPLRPEQFTLLAPPASQKTIAFVDGGQAEILSAGNFCLSFLRVATVVFAGQEKKRPLLSEFYLFTRSIFHENEIWYESKIFPLDASPLLTSEQLFISSRNPLLAVGKERAAITGVSSLARRFAELMLAQKVAADADVVILDGTLEATYPREEALLQQLGSSVCALAKTS
ncbi:MAG: DNA double-strand break repair nuclease NurA, partial [Nanoarchaeota archaeon]|nr:DNA double-strand break repair nuclease NurA [Nanoarchaeota archaeon]